jgi:hypothetical protein
MLAVLSDAFYESHVNERRSQDVNKKKRNERIDLLGAHFGEQTHDSNDCDVQTNAKNEGSFREPPSRTSAQGLAFQI